MIVENATPFEMRFRRDSVTTELSRVEALTRVVWRSSAGTLALSDAQPAVEWPALSAPTDSGYVQITVSGKVVAKDGEAFVSQDVTLDVGDQRRALRIFGPRQWVRRGSSVVASAAEPTYAVHMDWRNAFGGSHRRPPGIVPGTSLPGPSTLDCWPQNPGGTGYYRTLDEAVGSPLPSIEDPERPIVNWDDRPRPCCWASLPRDSSLRLDHVVIREQVLSTRDHPGRSPLLDAWATAPPELRLSRASWALGMRVRGLGDEMEVAPPPPAPFSWQLSFGRGDAWSEPLLSDVAILPNEQLLVCFYRTVSFLPLVRRHKRVATQLLAPGRR